MADYTIASVYLYGPIFMYIVGLYCYRLVHTLRLYSPSIMRSMVYHLLRSCRVMSAMGDSCIPQVTYGLVVIVEQHF